MSKSFDSIVIGTGQSGPPLAAKLAKALQKVAIIERARFGGTCVNTGCIPTKAMVASARVAHTARRGSDFGVNIDGAMKRVSFMKILVDADSKEILGASILGTGGDEAIHCILDVMYAKSAYTVLQRAVNIHPTVAELIPTMLGDLRPL